jgi:hypothetical protein
MNNSTTYILKKKFDGKKAIYSLLPTIFLFCGCFHYASSTSYDPLASVRLHASCVGENDLSKKTRLEFYENLKSIEVERENPLYIVIDNALSDVIKAYERLEKLNVIDPIEFNTFFVYENENKIDIKIFALKKPIAVSFPNREIYLSRSLLDSGLPFSAKNKNQVTALIAHETSHILQNHICYQWAIAESFNDFKEHKTKAELLNILSLLPFSYSNYVYSARDLSNLNTVNLFLEYQADLSTYFILDYLGIDPNEYVELLNGIYSYLINQKSSEYKLSPTGFNLDSLRNRIICLNILNSFRAENFPEYLIVKDTTILPDARGGGLETGKYISFKINNHPYLIKFAAFWTLALSQLGYQVTKDKIVVYNDNSAYLRNTLPQKIGPIINNNVLIYPLRLSEGLVLPEKYLEFPIFPFARITEKWR